jgi:thymidine kinase
MLSTTSGGQLNLILGPMFSGKSTALIQYIRKFAALKYEMIIVKPDIDSRYTKDEICTHNLDKEKCKILGIDELKIIKDMDNYKESRLILIEEGQFFNNLFLVVKDMIDIDHKIVIISALNGDSNRDNFGDIHKLIPHSDDITFLKALCIKCKDGTPAIFSKKINEDHQLISIGGSNKYEAVCRKHFLQ